MNTFLFILLSFIMSINCFAALPKQQNFLRADKEENVGHGVFQGSWVEGGEGDDRLYSFKIDLHTEGHQLKGKYSQVYKNGQSDEKYAWHTEDNISGTIHGNVAHIKFVSFQSPHNLEKEKQPGQARLSLKNGQLQWLLIKEPPFEEGVYWNNWKTAQEALSRKSNFNFSAEVSKSEVQINETFKVILKVMNPTNEILGFYLEGDNGGLWLLDSRGKIKTWTTGIHNHSSIVPGFKKLLPGETYTTELRVYISDLIPEDKLSFKVGLNIGKGSKGYPVFWSNELVIKIIPQKYQPTGPEKEDNYPRRPLIY